MDDIIKTHVIINRNGNAHRVALVTKNLSTRKVYFNIGSFLTKPDPDLEESVSSEIVTPQRFCELKAIMYQREMQECLDHIATSNLNEDGWREYLHSAAYCSAGSAYFSDMYGVFSMPSLESPITEKNVVAILPSLIPQWKDFSDHYDRSGEYNNAMSFIHEMMGFLSLFFNLKNHQLPPFTTSP